MASLEWDRCYQLGIPTFASAIACFAFSYALRGGAVRWASQALLAAGAALLVAALVFIALAVQRHPGSKRWLEWKLFLSPAIAAGLVVTAIRLSRLLADFAQGALLGIGVILLAEGIRRPLWAHYVRNRKAQTTLAAAPIQPQALADSEQVKHVRVVYKEYCRPPIQSARAFLLEIHPKLDVLPSYLLREYVFPHHLTQNSDALDKELELKRTPSEDEFAEILRLFRLTLLIDYIAVVVTLKLAGESIFGPHAFYGSSRYKALHDMHAKALEKLRETRQRDDLWFSSGLSLFPVQAIDSTVVDMWEACLPEPGTVTSAPPSEDPPGSKASEQSLLP